MWKSSHSMQYGFILLLSVFVCVKLEEYCENESLDIQCSPDHVIVMETAMYGRMRFGKCVDRDYGYLGCELDVLPIADRLCSGRRKCSISVPNPLFAVNLPCPRDLKPYLEANYSCVKVDSAAGQACRSGFSVPAARAGYLANVVATETGAGSSDCPWRLHVARHQTLSIRLWDFTSSAPSSGPSNDYDVCRYVYGTLRDRVKSAAHTICGGGGRVNTIYNATDDTWLEIRMSVGRVNNRPQDYFLLQYEVTGCADPLVASNVWMKRESGSGLLVSGCVTGDQQWTLSCNDRTGQWNGTVGNCSVPHVVASYSGREGFDVLGSVENSIIVVILTAVAVGIVILFIGFMMAKRLASGKRMARRRVDSETRYLHQGTSPHRRRANSAGAGGPPRSYGTSHRQRGELPPPPVPAHAVWPRDSTMSDEHDYSEVYETTAPPPTPAGRDSRLPSGNNNSPPHHQTHHHLHQHSHPHSHQKPATAVDNMQQMIAVQSNFASPHHQRQHPYQMSSAFSSAAGGGSRHMSDSPSAFCTLRHQSSTSSAASPSHSSYSTSLGYGSGRRPQSLSVHCSPHHPHQHHHHLQQQQRHHEHRQQYLQQQLLLQHHQAAAFATLRQNYPQFDADRWMHYLDVDNNRDNVARDQEVVTTFLGPYGLDSSSVAVATTLQAVGQQASSKQCQYVTCFESDVVADALASINAALAMAAGNHGDSGSSSVEPEASVSGGSRSGSSSSHSAGSRAASRPSPRIERRRPSGSSMTPSYYELSLDLSENETGAGSPTADAGDANDYDKVVGDKLLIGGDSDDVFVGLRLPRLELPTADVNHPAVAQPSRHSSGAELITFKQTQSPHLSSPAHATM